MAGTGLHKLIVVGVDGSAGARKALAWAADEARLRQAAIEAVHAWELPQHLALDDALEAAAAEVLRSDVREALGPDPDVEVRLWNERGSAAEVLLARSGDADMLVVGSRGKGGFSGLLLGSVSQKLVSHAICPVVVVR